MTRLVEPYHQIFSEMQKYSMSLLYRKVMLLPSLMQLYRLEAKSLSMQRGHCRTVLFEKGSPFLGVEKNLLTGLSGNTSNVVVLSQALPPDLARKQVNPLTLPGFSLPQGQNGLFRLASQGALVNQASGALKSASDLTQSGHGVSVSAQTGSGASGWSTQARRVGDDRVTSLAGSAYQGRVAEAIDALRASAPISGDGETLAVSRPVSTRRPRDWVDSSRAMHRVTAAMVSSSPICAVVHPRSQAFPRLIVFKAQCPVTMGMELFSPIGRVRRRRSRPRLRQCV